MKITLDNTTNFFTKKRIIIIIITFVIYGLFLELFMQPCSKLVCKDALCKMYSKRGRLNKDILEYSFSRADISNYKIQKHTHIGGTRYRTYKNTTYSLILILKNNHTIHLPHYIEKEQVEYFYKDLKSYNDIVKFTPYYVYRFE